MLNIMQFNQKKARAFDEHPYLNSQKTVLEGIFEKLYLLELIKSFPKRDESKNISKMFYAKTLPQCLRYLSEINL